MGAIITLRWTALSLTILIGTIILYYVAMIVMCHDWFALAFEWTTWKVGIHSEESILGNATGWIMFITVTMFSLVPDVMYEAYRTNIGVDPLTVQMYHERAGDSDACFFGKMPPDSWGREFITIAPSKEGTTT